MSPGVSIGPVVPDPGTGGHRNVVSDGLDENTVNVELRRGGGQPVDSVLVPCGVSIRRSGNTISRVRRAVGHLLIGEPGLGDVSSQEGKVGLLSVVRIEDKTMGSTRHI